MSDAALSQLTKLLLSLEDASARLNNPADQDALHAMRVALRRLRTLLRPLRRRPLVRDWLQVAAVLARQSGPLRDDEVLLAELRAHRQQAAVRRYAARVRRARLALSRSDVLGRVRVTAATVLADVQAGGVRWRPPRAAARRARQALLAWQQQERGDLHDLRLRLKRLRFSLQADGGAPANLQAQLRQLQALLGAWHDHDVWLQRAATDVGLLPCVSRWQREQLVLEARLPPLLDGLWHALST